MFRAERQRTATPHYYAVYRPDAAADWLDRLADVYVALRAAPRSPLHDPTLGIEVVERANVERLLATATVPRLTTGDWRDIIRADLGEVLAYELLEGVYGTRIAYKLVRDRELTQFPGRGIDAIGAEPLSAGGEPMPDPPHQRTEEMEATAGAPQLTAAMLVLVEVKVSDEDASPPQVVDTGDLSMRSQHLGHLSEWEKTMDKVWLAVRNATDPKTFEYLTQIALRLARDKTSVFIVACCVLVRPRLKVADTDCGTFEAKPTDYVPARVRFLTVALPSDMEATLTDWNDAIGRAIDRRGGAGAETAA